MIPAPSPSLLRRIIAWRDSLYKAWAAKKAPPVKGKKPRRMTNEDRALALLLPLYDGRLRRKPAKNPRRVEGGKKAARTRALRKAEARMVELYGEAAQHPDAEVTP